MGCISHLGLCEIVAMTNKVQVLNWARSQPPPHPWDLRTFKLAVMNGSIEALEFMYEREFFFRRYGAACVDAVAIACKKEGPVKIIFNSEKFATLSWLRSRNPPYPLPRICLSIAGEARNYEVLNWSRDHDQPCPWPEDFLLLPASQGNIEMIR